MRGVKLLVLAILVVTVLTGCGGNRDIEVSVYVGGTAPAAPIAEATQPPAAAVEPTALREPSPFGAGC